MFEDLITEVPKDEEVESSIDVEAALSQEDEFMYNLLTDTEEVIDELFVDQRQRGTECIWCGCTPGQRHSDTCFFLTTLRRLQAEIDTLANKTHV